MHFTSGQHSGERGMLLSSKDVYIVRLRSWTSTLTPGSTLTRGLENVLLQTNSSPQESLDSGTKRNSRDVKSHVCAQTTHVVLPPPRLSCGVGSGVVNLARFRQNWLRGFGSLRGQNLPFSYT